MSVTSFTVRRNKITGWQIGKEAPPGTAHDGERQQYVGARLHKGRSRVLSSRPKAVGTQGAIQGLTLS